MKGEYTPPTFRGDGFNCPHCGVFAHQDWYDVSLENAPVDEEKEASDDLALSYCDKCGSYAVWIKDEMIFPQPSVVPLPLEEMPDDVKEIYNEARDIMNASPRSAAALLRYAIQLLMYNLGEEGENINDVILDLRNKGLDVKIQTALDSVKVTGEEAINPGQIDPRDDDETSQVLFNLLNLSLPSKKGSKKKGNEFLFRAKIGE
jgi:hypothetical protein